MDARILFIPGISLGTWKYGSGALGAYQDLDAPVISFTIQQSHNGTATMKHLVLGALNELMRDLRDISKMPFGIDENERLGYEALALRVEGVSQMVGNYFDLQDESARNAVRWKFLFQTQGISFTLKDDQYIILKDLVEGGEIVSRRMLSSGKTLQQAVDAFLGFR